MQKSFEKRAIINRGGLKNVQEQTKSPLKNVQGWTKSPSKNVQGWTKSPLKNVQAKSLKSFVKKYNTKINIRTSMTDYKKEEWLTNIPLYSIGNIEKIFK